ncbi:MAG: hypothetical protein WD716_00055 [Fimbriimonadaceae bacterium]
MRPIDVQIADKDVEKAREAVEVVWRLTREAHVEPVRVGSLIELVELKPTIAVRD